MIRVEITKSGLAAIGRRGFQAAGRESLYEVALHWWSTYLPLHFQNIAYLRYRFAPRDKRYTQLKRDRLPFADTPPAIGEVKPLVFTGRTRERVLSHPNIKAKAPNFETYRADVILDAPVLNFSSEKRINLRDEITRDTPQEHQVNEKIFAREWNKRLRAQGLRATRQRKVIAA